MSDTQNRITSRASITGYFFHDMPIQTITIHQKNSRMCGMLPTKFEFLRKYLQRISTDTEYFFADDGIEYLHPPTASAVLGEGLTS